MYPRSKLPPKKKMEPLYTNVNAQKMLREIDEMESGSQDAAKSAGVSTDEMSRKKREEKIRNR